MDDFLALRRKTPTAIANQADIRAGWLDLRPLIHTIPEPETLADYCRGVEGFRKLRPAARSPIAEQVKALDALLWEKDLLGRVPQVCLDLFASRYALEMVNVLTRVDERLKEEKQKLSALDFDDLELKALALLERPEVLTRAAERYKFFLVDEFQDTNRLQRQLLQRLALPQGRRGGANLFIVGDRKQSVYGFRGADVNVFREMTEALVAAGGESKPLRLNFRSQPPLINFFNYLFERLFQPDEGVTRGQLEELGHVEHEPSEAMRELRDAGPLVELMITTEASGEDDPKAEQTSRQLDAEQLAKRIITLVDHGIGSAGTAGVSPAPSNEFTQGWVESDNSENVAFKESGRDARGPRKSVKFSEIALLFRAMTHVQTYESAFRRANIPYQTVLGRGFYEREEITDLIQLLRFLDNKTDELALAAVLRSPFCGISDNALLALRCAPWLAEVETGDPLRHFTQTRRLFQALRRHHEIAFIIEEEHELLDRAADLISRLIARRHHYAIGDLLRFAVEQSEYMTIIAATFDGAQRLANVQRLFTLAARFERSGTHLIRDFVRYVEEFEAIGSRESEGQIDEAANAVRLMTIHQAKGLEFPVVIIPDLQRSSKPLDNWFLLDRHQGLTLRVPDGRGKLVAGSTFNSFEQRHALREQFESMRLLYVAATRAQDRLIFSGTTAQLDNLSGKSDTWLKWIRQSLDLVNQVQSGVVDLTDAVQLQLTLNLAEQTEQQLEPGVETSKEQELREGDSLLAVFPLLHAVEPEPERVLHRFSVTQLINYQRCPRQYYFDRVLHVPAADEMAVWNNAEAPEPPANLTATLKGAVIHRFCERYSVDQKPREVLRQSFDEVVRLRQAELADRLGEIDPETALKDLLPLAEHYLASDVFSRVERAHKATSGAITATPLGETGLWNELSFRLRRPLGVLSGTIDKLLITRSLDGRSLEIEIIDFKTNRFPKAQSRHSKTVALMSARPKGKQHLAAATSTGASPQIVFDFSVGPSQAKIEAMPDPVSVDEGLRVAAQDYLLQMQAYALAVRELIPELESQENKIQVTLHFLEPNLEFHLADNLLAPEACKQAIDEAITQIVSASEPEHFPVNATAHCRMCNFLSICTAGREWVRRRSFSHTLGV